MKITERQIRGAISALKTAYPNMTDNGLDDDCRYHKKTIVVNSRFIAEVNTAYEWLKFVIGRHGARKTKNPMASSYGIKHLMEKWGAKNHMSFYVRNMAGIVAMQLHPLVKIYKSPRSTNPCTNLPTKALRGERC